MDLSEKYLPLFEVPEGVDTYIVTGGRFSQKSFAVSTASCVWAHNEEHRVLYTRYTNVSSKDSTFPELEEKINMLGLEDDFHVTNGRIESNTNKSKIVFKGLKTGSLNQTANLKSIKDFSAWVLEEAEELDDYDLFEKVSLSIRGNSKESGKPNLKVLILNPTTKDHWIYKHFFEQRGVNAGFNGVKDNVCYIHTSYKDCIKFVPDSIVRDFAHMEKTNPNRYKHIVLGGWLEKADGAIFNEWEYGEFDYSLPCVYGQDFGYSVDPTTLIKVAIDDKRKVLYLDECYFKEGLSTSDIYQSNIEHVRNRDLVIADSAEPRLIRELANKGLNIKPTVKGPGSVLAGISLMLDYKIVISERSTNLAKELNNYAWSDKKSETPIDKHNHGIDAARYAVGFLKMKPKKVMMRRG